LVPIGNLKDHPRLKKEKEGRSYKPHLRLQGGMNDGPTTQKEREKKKIFYFVLGPDRDNRGNECGHVHIETLFQHFRGTWPAKNGCRCAKRGGKEGIRVGYGPMHGLFSTNWMAWKAFEMKIEKKVGD